LALLPRGARTYSVVGPAATATDALALAAITLAAISPARLSRTERAVQ
jgi:hypothetical protein